MQTVFRRFTETQSMTAESVLTDIMIIMRVDVREKSQQNSVLTYLPHVNITGHLGPFFLVSNKWTKPFAFRNDLCGPDTWGGTKKQNIR